MKLKLRFIWFFVKSLFAFILLTGLFAMVSIEHIIPIIFSGAVEADIASIISIFIPFIIGGILFGLFFVNPLVTVLSLVRTLTKGDYDISEINTKLYNKNGKLKRRYGLYKELVDDINTLSQKLITVEREREKLEEAKTNWISGVSHDLKTPLSYITGYSSLLLEKQEQLSQNEQINFIEKIHEKSVYITELIGDLNLSFKLDALEGAYPLNLQKINIIDFLQRLLADIINNPTAIGYDFGFEAKEDELFIEVDQKLLYRALQNIIMNSVTHNPVGTTINIYVDKASDDKQIIIKIEDNGIGMNSQTLSKLFSPYDRPEETENLSGGFGLFLVKGIIDAHNGKIEATSAEGEGTVFKIFL